MNEGSIVPLPPRPRCLYLSPAALWPSPWGTATSLSSSFNPHWVPGTLPSSFFIFPLLLLIPGCASKTLSPGFACLPLLSSSILHRPLSFEILLSKTSGYLFSVSGLCLSPYCSNHWGHHHFLEHSAFLHLAFSFACLATSLCTCGCFQ